MPQRRVAGPSQVSEGLERGEGGDRSYSDTAGRSPRGAKAIRELTDTLRPVEDLEVHLTLAANMDSNVVDATLERYDDLGIDRLTVTKLDEAHDLGQLVSTPARLGRPISYLAAGQRIPEDIEGATQQRLVELACGTSTVMEAAA